MLNLSKSSKIALIIIEFCALLFIVAGIMIILDPDEDGPFIGWCGLICGLFAAIYAPFAFSKQDESTKCPSCGKPGALELTRSELMSSEPIVKTEKYYKGREVTPYQVTGKRNCYLETYTCKHCGHSFRVRNTYDEWDVNVY